MTRLSKGALSWSRRAVLHLRRDGPDRRDNRPATIVIDEEAECLVISRTDLGALDSQFPRLKVTAYENLTRSLSRRLRESLAEIATLAG